MSLRKERLADELRNILGSLFQGGRLEDPRLKDVTISAVKLSPDLQLATVYFRIYPGGDVAAATNGLRSATGLMRRELTHYLKIRRVPELKFFYDESIERGARVEELIRTIHTN